MDERRSRALQNLAAATSSRGGEVAPTFSHCEMDIVTLALDLGTDTGYAVLRADGRIESGTERFKPGANEGPGMRFVKFKRWLLEVKQANPELARIFFERVVAVGPNQAYAAQVYGGFLACVGMFGEHHSIKYEGIAVGTIKKQFAGSGRALKQDVIDQCRSMGFKPEGHNEADAIALLHVATGRCALLTMSGATPKGPRAPRPQPTLLPGQDAF